MLRHYDKVGLLKPDSLDPVNGYRLYAAQQLVVAHKISTLRDMGFGIEDLKRLVALDDDGLLEQLALREGQLTEDLNQSKRKLSLVSDLKHSIMSGGKAQHYEMEIKAIPAFDALAMRVVIPCYEDERLAWESLGAYIKANAITVSEPYQEYCEFCHEGGLGVDIKVVVAVDEKRQDEAPFHFIRTEALERAASILVYGPYAHIATVYASFATWLEEHPTLQMAGNTREIAHVGSWNAENPEDYLTEFLIPVTDRA